MRAVAVLTVVLACSGPLSAQAPGRVDAIDSSVVAAFADEFFPSEMPRRHIPGAVFVFVSNGEIALARGYGAAQLKPPRPVDPVRTVFRLASVSKTITATAATSTTAATITAPTRARSSRRTAMKSRSRPR